MAKPIKKKKDRFSGLEDDFKDEIVAMNAQEIDQKISGWAKLIEATRETMKQDQDLAGKREAARLACQPYYQDIKLANLRIAWAIQVLGDRGTK